MGKEPIWAGGEVVAYVTSASYGYSIGRGIVYGYLPADLAVEGTLGRGRVLRRARTRPRSRPIRSSIPRANG